MAGAMVPAEGAREAAAAPVAVDWVAQAVVTLAATRVEDAAEGGRAAEAGMVARSEV